MGSSSTPQFQSARVMRAALLTQIDHYLAEAVASPEAGPNIDRALEAFDGAVALHAELVTLLSTSSDRRYAVTDLLADERTVMERVTHNMKIMRALYGPQAAH